MSKLNWGMRTCGVFLLWAAAAIALSAQTTGVALHEPTLTTLFAFCTPTNCKDGASPNAGLVQGTDGNFYGTTVTGGGFEGGTVFKIAPSGKVTKLHNFVYGDGGAFPEAALDQGIDGDFYGTTSGGGGSCDGNGCGAVFKITPSGVLTTLHSFDLTDGWAPSALVQGTDGNFYGTTGLGGSTVCNQGYGCGTIFKITPSGMFTTIYIFCPQGGSTCTDGANPKAALVKDANGEFFGTTEGGGANDAGTVFQITSNGVLTTLYSICSQSGCLDGEYPVAGLVHGTDGELYGTTAHGGANDNRSCSLGGATQGCGTVFRITSNGVITILYSFCSMKHCVDGSEPIAGLVQATDGNFYGTTEYGGTSRHGTAFKLTPKGVLTTLHDFCSQGYPCTDGFGANALIQATNGDFYATTEYGATRSHACHYGCGTVFSFSVGLGPFVETQPTFGEVGKAVKILGTNLTGATSVTFNGIPATFTVVSGSMIKTTVPTGATTGKVRVTFPHGTRSSNVPFRVK
jgi:uncharacterized repeat protein (TIGR03803 family)